MMKHWHLSSVLMFGLATVAGHAQAYYEAPGILGVPACSADARCWVNQYGVMYNICNGAGDYKLLYMPLTHHPTSTPPGPAAAVVWNARFYASANTMCSITVVPDDGTSTPASSACGFAIPANGSAGAASSSWGWCAGPSSPMTVSTPATAFTAAYAACWVPPGGWIETFSWWQ
jgi:hypothetical protein